MHSSFIPKQSVISDAYSPPSPTTTPIIPQGNMDSAEKTILLGGKTKQRIQQKDEQIRRQAESSLAKQALGRPARRANIRGAGLGEAATIFYNQNIYEAARALAAKRTNCLLVINGQGKLVGIITDKDLAFRVVAQELDPQATLVEQVMTPEPQCVQIDTPLPEAIQLMAARHFRHLPCLEGETIVGVLDIAKCVCEALKRIEKASEAASQLEKAFKAVEKEFGKTVAESDGIANKLRNQLSTPTLASLLDLRIQPADLIASPKSSVLSVVQQMKANKSTAIIINEEGQSAEGRNSEGRNVDGRNVNGQNLEDQKFGVQGIFTTKDLVLRVLAAGLDPHTTSIVRVMTPKPDGVTTEITAVAALQQMESGHYLHLPVLSHPNGKLLGIITVLQLACHIVEQLETLEGKGSSVWNQLWILNKSEQSLHSKESLLTGTNAKSSLPITMVQSQEQPFREQPFREQLSKEQPWKEHSSIGEDAKSINSLEESCNLSTLLFKVKWGKVAAYIPIPLADQNDNFGSISKQGIINEACTRHGIEREHQRDHDLIYIDEEGDTVPLHTDQDLHRIIRMVQNVGKCKLQLELIEKKDSTLKASEKAPPPPSSSLAGWVIGSTVVLVAAVSITGLVLFQRMSNIAQAQ